MSSLLHSALLRLTAGLAGLEPEVSARLLGPEHVPPGLRLRGDARLPPSVRVLLTACSEHGAGTERRRPTAPQQPRKRRRTEHIPDAEFEALQLSARDGEPDAGSWVVHVVQLRIMRDGGRRALQMQAVWYSPRLQQARHASARAAPPWAALIHFFT